MSSPLPNLIIYLTVVAGVVVAQGTTPPGPTHPGVPSSCNSWHIVESGNTCATITSQYGITHEQFLDWNPAVSADCVSNFWAGYAYCVGVGDDVATTTTTTAPTASPTRVTEPPGPTFTDTPDNCNSWHLVESGDTCGDISAHYGLTLEEFLEYNPAVSEDCSTNFWLGYAYCVGLGPPITSSASASEPEVTSSSSSWVNTTYSVRHPVTEWELTTPVIDDSVWPPTQTQPGQPNYCNDWHLVTEGQTCRSIWHMHRTWMSLDDFFAWNPAVGTDCSGLYVNHYVCVGIQPQTIGTVVIPAATDFTMPPYVSWTPEPLPSVDGSFSPTPSHGPMPANCANFYLALPGNTCNDILAEHEEITREDFFDWNPVLNGNCNGLWGETYYCVAAYPEGVYPQPPTVTAEPSPVAEDTTTECVAWYEVRSEEEECDIIAAMFGTFSTADFKAWNPSVEFDCSGIEVGYYYCVAIPGTPTTRTEPITPSTVEPGSPDTSDPATVTDPGDSTTTPDTTTAPTTTISEAPVSTPQPIQGVMIEGCRRFYFVESGDGCWQIATDAGITLDDFYEWNPAAAPDCSAMWANIYVCVGVSGPVATFSGVPPQPT